jgi:mono/diheme cytochrome c family protein
MSPRLWVALIVGQAAVVAAMGTFLFGAPAQSEQSQTSAGRQLYLENCARCHGVDLEGQPEWMKRKEDGRLPAPPHDETGHTWHHSDKQLFTITKQGLGAIEPGYESDMPAFRDVLSDDEIVAILEYVKSTWPEREREYQKARSAADAE